MLILDFELLAGVVFSGATLAVKTGGVLVEGLIACPELLLVLVVTDELNVFNAGGVAALAHNPPAPALVPRNLASIEGLKSAGIKIRIGLLGSTTSPR